MLCNLKVQGDLEAWCNLKNYQFVNQISLKFIVNEKKQENLFACLLLLRNQNLMITKLKAKTNLQVKTNTNALPLQIFKKMAHVAYLKENGNKIHKIDYLLYLIHNVYN